MNTDAHRRTRRTALLALLGLPLLGACGFHLRGPQPMAFSSIHLGMGAYSELAAALRRQIPNSGTTQVEDDPTKAEALLHVLRDARTRDILSLNAAGKVREYRLGYDFAFRLSARDGRELIPPTELHVQRDMTYDDANILAKEQEEALLFKDMQSDIVQQLLRRLAAAHMP